jgi:hypothetical protein
MKKIKLENNVKTKARKKAESKTKLQGGKTNG